MNTSDLDKIANDYWKTKDPELKKLWYKKNKDICTLLYSETKSIW